MKGRHAVIAAVAAASSLLGAAHDAGAAPRWVDRPMTLPRLVFAGDVGIGLGHRRVVVNTPGGPANNDDVLGLGMNLEGALGITDSVELGLRTGFRFGNDGKATQADGYARTLWTETWGTNYGTVANPEFKIRWAAYSGRVAEIGLDGRMFLPVETDSDFGLQFGVPLAFHIGNVLRIDTGAYIPIVFSDPAFNAFSIPGYFWIQPSNRLWLGPMTALRFINEVGPGGHDTHLLLGFGMGYQVANAVDLKWQVFHPRITDDGGFRNVGAGFGVQFRIE